MTSFVSFSYKEHKPVTLSIHLPRSQNSPQKDEILILDAEGKAYKSLYSLSEIASNQAKNIADDPSPNNVKALRKTQAKLLRSQQNGVEVSKPVLDVIEAIFSTYRRKKHG
jgi:hypothetical protein